MTDLDSRPVEVACPAHEGVGPVVEEYPAREVPLGGIRAAVVSRTLPQRGLSTVGAWCFLDAFTPGDVPMNVLPHPHIGLQTVTWPLAGRMLHRDSLGSVQELRPGELNLMTSGDGIAHSEFMVDATGARGLQLWLALPEGARDEDAAFEHIAAGDLPVLGRDGMRAVVFIGALEDARSPARVHSPLVGAQVDVAAGTEITLALDPGFEHALQVVDGALTVHDDDAHHPLVPGPLLYLGTGRTHLTVSASRAARFLLLGGEPFGEDLLMWWNFVGRTHEEIVAARSDWEDPAARVARYGVVAAHGADRIPAPPLPNARLTPRRHRR